MRMRAGSIQDMGIEINPGVTMPFEKVYAQTVANAELSTQVEFIQSFFEDWVGEFVNPLEKDLHRARKLENSLYFCYLASQSMVFDWLAHTLLSGAYEVVLRELRSILEGLFVAYYVDVNYKSETLEQKIGRLRLLEEKRSLSGKKVFESSKISNWKDYYSLYGELCAYVHNSIKVVSVNILLIAQEGFPQAVEARFDKNTFMKSVELWKRVAMAATDLASALLEELNVPIEHTNLEIFKIKTA